MAKHIPHLFLEKSCFDNKKLLEDDFHHLVKVLRFKENDKFIGLDNLGNKYKCLVSQINKHDLLFEIQEEFHFENNNFNLNLIQAVPKIETFEEILDKATQLGVNKITPVITDNVTVSTDIFKKKYVRFNKILKSASEQSQRIFMPVLENIINLNEFQNNFNSSETFIAYEKSDIPFKHILSNYKNQNINILCGPEGGFSEREAEQLSEKFKTFSLGKNILRAETAVISALSNILYELN